MTRAAEPSDLLARAAAGDEAAFTALVGPQQRSIFRHCYRMLGSGADAEDAVQDTLERAFVCEHQVGYGTAESADCGSASLCIFFVWKGLCVRMWAVSAANIRTVKAQARLGRVHSFQPLLRLARASRPVSIFCPQPEPLPRSRIPAWRKYSARRAVSRSHHAHHVPRR